MSIQPLTKPDADTPDAPTTPKGSLRRFFAGWRRLEEALDYGPYDYTNDRLRALERRIEQLEQRLAAAPNDESSPKLHPISPAPSTHQR